MRRRAARTRSCASAGAHKRRQRARQQAQIPREKCHRRYPGLVAPRYRAGRDQMKRLNPRAPSLSLSASFGYRAGIEPLGIGRRASTNSITAAAANRRNGTAFNADIAAVTLL